jgi:hypothetical protein
VLGGFPAWTTKHHAAVGGNFVGSLSHILQRPGPFSWQNQMPAGNTIHMAPFVAHQNNSLAQKRIASLSAVVAHPSWLIPRR